MERLEAIHWVVTMRMAQKGDKEAQEVLKQEEEVRKELGKPSLREELAKMAEEQPSSEEDREKLQALQDDSRVPWKRKK